MNPQNPEIKIEIDEATARGIYTNLAFISHSETEIVLDFTFLQPQTAKAKVLARLITSPLHAKRLLAALQDGIAKYEERFGALPGDAPAPTPKPVDFYQ